MIWLVLKLWILANAFLFAAVLWPVRFTLDRKLPPMPSRRRPPF